MHIGSQTGGLEPFAEAFERLTGFVRELRGAGFKIHKLDLGGGLSIRYRDEVRPSRPTMPPWSTGCSVRSMYR